MWLNPQSWSVISGLATPEQADLALDSVFRELNTDYGAMVMYPPYKEHAFDPIVNGEGVGLDRVKDIIVAHGGTITVKDNPGGGAIFVITLPMDIEVIEEAEMIED